MTGYAPRDWRDRALALSSRLIAKPLMAMPLPWGVHRAAMKTVAAARRPPPKLDVDAVRLGPRAARIAAPPDPKVTALWFHGGGFTVGSPETHAHLTDTIAVEGVRIVAPSYRLAPEHPFPAGYEDCLAAARALAAQGPFALGGDSAGATLAASVLAQLLADGTPPLRVALIAPAGDFDPMRPDPDGADDLFLSRPLLERIARAYAAGHDPRDPRLSPVFAEFPDCPPVLIHCSKGEILESDAEALAARFRAGGASVRIVKGHALPHAWHMAAGHAPAADAALREVAAFLRGDRPGTDATP